MKHWERDTYNALQRARKNLLKAEKMTYEKSDLLGESRKKAYLAIIGALGEVNKAILQIEMPDHCDVNLD